jgi:hypothetical protein
MQGVRCSNRARCHTNNPLALTTLAKDTTHRAESAFGYPNAAASAHSGIRIFRIWPKIFFSYKSVH